MVTNGVDASRTKITTQTVAFPGVFTHTIIHKPAVQRHLVDADALQAKLT